MTYGERLKDLKKESLFENSCFQIHKIFCSKVKWPYQFSVFIADLTRSDDRSFSSGFSVGWTSSGQVDLAGLTLNRGWSRDFQRSFPAIKF